MSSLVRRVRPLLVSLLFFAERAGAQVYNGPGLYGGVAEASLIAGPSHQTLRGAILNLLYKILSYLALAAVFVIVMAGFYLVVSNGSDEVKGKVKNIIIYVIVGLLIVLFARSIVGFITQALYQ